MNELLNVSAAPHIRNRETTRSIMFDVAVALIPAGVFGIFNFGLKALIIILFSVGTCVGVEYIYQKRMGKKSTISDYSAVVTGLLIAYNLPSTVPFWMPIIGGIFAMIFVKHLFGGIGQNFMNPALAARCFLLISFSKIMTNFGIQKTDEIFGIIKNGYSSISKYGIIDGTSSATMLEMVKRGGEFNILDMFMGTTAGTIGETSAIAILIGGGYLLAKKIISPRIPVTYILSFICFLILLNIMSGNSISVEYILGNILGGGLLLGAFFMATDYVTSPITPKGKIVFGVLLGFITAVLRIFGGSAEGVSYAIIFSNLLVPLVEKITIPKAFGRGVTINGK